MRNITLNAWGLPLNNPFCGLRPRNLAVLGCLWLAGGHLLAATTVTTLGGGSVSRPYSGNVDGNTLSAAKFAMPAGMALDPTGTALFLADYTNNAIRLVSHVGNAATSVTSTFANATNGAGISHPLAVVVDSATNVYVLNQGTGANGAVLHLGGVAMNSGLLTIYPALTSGLVNATAMAMDGYNNLYVTVNGNKVIRVTTNKVVTTIGTISQSGTSLRGIAVLDNGQLALSDAGNHGIWIMNPLSGTSTKLTGFHGLGDALGSASLAAFNTPANVAKAGGGMLVVADSGNNKVKLVDQSGTVSLLYGVSSNLWVTGSGTFPGWADGSGGATQGSAESRLPYGVLVGSDGSVYVSEDYYHVLRRVTGTGLSAPQPGYLPSFNGPAGIAFDSLGNYLFIANYTNNMVQILDFSDNLTSTFLAAADGVQNPASVLVDANENVYVLNQGTLGNGFIQVYDIYGNDYGPIITGLNQPTALAMDGYGNIFVTEQSGKIRAFGNGISSTLATVTNANVSLQGIAFFDDGTIAVSDAGNHVIWAVNPITKLITKLTGQLGTNGAAVGASNFAKLYQPHQLARVSGNQIVAADYGNNRIVLVQRNGTVITNNSTYHLNSTNATIWFGTATDPVANGNSKFVPMVSPFGVAAGNGGVIYASEVRYGDIRGLLGTGIGSPTSNPSVPIPVFSSMAGIALNNESTSLFIADPTNNTINQLNLANNQTTVFLDSSSGIYQPVDVGLDANDNVYVLNQGTGGNGSIMEFDKYGNFLGTNAAFLAQPTAMKLSFAGDIYVSERNGMVQKFSASGSNTLANITTNANVSLSGIALLDNGAVVVSDAGNHVVWKIAPGTTNAVLFTGVIGTSGTTFGGVGFAKLNKPMRLAEAFGGQVLIADSGNNRVVVANDLGTVSSALVSSNANLWFGLPTDPVSSGNAYFVAMLSPVGVAIGKSGTVFASENVYKDVRGILNTGIQAPIPPPPAPLNLVATATYGQVSLTWSAASGATNYYVKRATSTNASFSIIGTSTTTSYVDTAVVSGTTYYYVVSAVNLGGESPNSAIATAMPLIPAPPAPRIGWFDYEGNFFNGFFTVLHPFSILIFNNDQQFAIDPNTNGVSTYYTTDGSTPNATNGSTPPFYQDGLGFAQSLTLPPTPDQVVKAINIDAIGQVSPITTAEVVYQAANPIVIGFNGAQFTISDITTNVTFWYTTDGSDPTNAPPSLGPIAANETNAATLSLVVTSNVLFKARAFRSGYFPSGIAVQSFSPSNFVANTISFGFASGEASSDFTAAAGQTFYAPVTLSTLPSAVIYSLQFNMVVTNGGPNPGPAVTPNAFGFQSMLMKPDPKNKGLFLPILPIAYVAAGVNPQPNPGSFLYDGDWFQSLEAVNSLENLLTVGWVERAGKTNLYDTTTQDLIEFSLAHDDLFPNKQFPNSIILGGYSFTVPTNAANGQTYQIQIARPSATSDGIGAPGSDVFIAAPTNGATTGGAPINALKYVTVGQLKYIAGSVYPFRWFNAGDFGSSNIVNADVEQVFQSAIYFLNTPPAGSDFFDAMDSCGNFGTLDGDSSDLNFNYYTNSNPNNIPANQLTPAQQSALFNGNDTTINQIAFGDGSLDVCDVYVTFRRSLDPSLTWFRRFWNNGKLVADTNAPNVASHLAIKPATVKPKVGSGSTVPPQVNFSAGDVQGSAGQVVQVPINATIFGSYPLRVLMLNLTVEALDGSPALTSPVQFVQNAAVLGTPYTAGSADNNNFSAVWLNSTNSGLAGDVTIGTLFITIPAGAPANAAYAVHFDHASGSPNGLASFPKRTVTGLVTLSSHTNSTYGDSIPDSWRLRWFGTVHNYLSVSNACPSGDGVNNWKKFVAGVDPNTANDFPTTKPKTVPVGATTAIHWPTVSGTKYAIERANSLFNGPWTILSTNVGTGGDMEFDDANAASMKFYRVRIVP